MRESIATTVWMPHASSVVELRDPNATIYYYLHEGDMSKEGWIKICDVTVEFERPNSKVVIGAAVRAMRQQQDKINLKAAEATAALEETISKLLSLEYSA